jgi:hypothetical protein
MQIKIKTTNRSSVPIHYLATKLIFERVSINPPHSISVLFPEQSGTILSNLYTSQSEIVNNGDGFIGEVEYQFWTSSAPRKKYKYWRKFKLALGVNTFILDELFTEP